MSDRGSKSRSKSRSRSPPRRSRSRSRSPPRGGGGGDQGGGDRGGDRGGGGGGRDRQGFSVLVRNITHGTPSDRVRETCEKYGSVADVHMPLDFHCALHLSAALPLVGRSGARASVLWGCCGAERARRCPRAARRPKGFAFVEFESEDDGRACIAQLDGFVLDGRPLQVCQAKAKRKTGEQMREQDGPPRGGYGPPRGYDRGPPPRGYDRGPPPRGYGGGGGYDRDRGYGRRRSRSRSRSPPRRRSRSRSRSRDRRALPSS